ncbi:MAG: dynamin family protein [Gemmatimonadaceae bacterium]|nr:dynamin family protein [Gemmatimonadaceae bacterium]MDQ3517551.1 dynamin family protein [Gemmatimonadota bacterium]
MEQVLTRQQGELVALERRLVLRVRDALAKSDAPPADVERLASLVNEMDELFLLVIVGEYNTGKSTFINALLGDEVFAMGDLPTTRAISILSYGEAGPPKSIGENVHLYHYPLEVLRDLDIVDTPGTNSIERMEEAITRGFVPRADLVLFVTSLLQPLTASELDFLTHIREWGKKVVFVVNGVDRRNSDDQVDRVREYLTREITTRLGASSPTMYFISALQALRGKLAVRRGATAPAASGAPAAASVAPDPRNEYPALEKYVLETLREIERVRLKLLTPLGVLRNLLKGNITALDGRLLVVHEDARVLRSIREQLDAYSAEMRSDSERYLIEVRNVLYELEGRGRSWFERTIRIGNANFLRNKDAVENRFRAEVVRDSPNEIEGVVHRMVDWTVQRNLRLWSSVFAELDAHTVRLRESGALAPHGDTEFHYNREELFARLREPIERRLGEFDTDKEARQIVESVKEAVTTAFGVNVLAIGLGGILVAAFTTAALDVTGVLTATIFAIAGWLIIPARRRRLVNEFEAKIAKLNEDLAKLLRTKFEEQLGRYEQQIVEIVAPYGRFLETERVKLESGLGELRDADREVTTLEQRVMATFPERN